MLTVARLRLVVPLHAPPHPLCTPLHRIPQAHTGPVVSVERSPFFDDIILTAGDWQFQIWKEGAAAPLFQSGYAREYYTAGE